MDEQGIYCTQCRAYVHFWCLSEAGKPPAGFGVKGIVPGTPIEMPEACKQCGFKGTFQTSDLRTRRIPTEPARLAMLADAVRRPMTINIQDALGDKKPPGST